MLRSQWAYLFIEGLGYQPTFERVHAITAWAAAENTQAAYNPLATTYAVYGATDFNSANVRNFVTLSDGLAASLLTIGNGLYTKIFDAIYSNSSLAIANAIDSSPWGTHGVAEVLANAIGEIDIEMSNSIATAWIPTLANLAPVSEPTPSPVPSPVPSRVPDITHVEQRYIVRPGDTLSAIAAKFSMGLDELIGANLGTLDEVARQHGLANSANGKWIWPGEVLTIP